MKKLVVMDLDSRLECPFVFLNQERAKRKKRTVTDKLREEILSFMLCRPAKPGHDQKCLPMLQTFQEYPMYY